MENYDGKMRLAGKITLKNYFQDISGAAVLMVDGTISQIFLLWQFYKVVLPQL